jgi:hypothetical protein
MSFMYLSVTTGPAIMVVYFGMRRNLPNIPRTKIYTKQLFLIFLGWVVWMALLILWLIFPEDKTMFVISFVLTMIAWVLSSAAALQLFMPTDSQVARVAVELADSCVKCAAVKEYLKEWDQVPQISYEEQGSGFRGTFSVPSMQISGGKSLPSHDFTSIGISKKVVTEDLYLKVATYWLAIPAFQTLLSAMMDTDSKMVVMGNYSGLVPTETRAVSDSRTEAAHEVCIALHQGLVVKGPMFDANFFCGRPGKMSCSFSLKQGISPLQRAVQSGFVIVRDVEITKSPPYEGVLYACSNLSKALPYLLSGYTMSDHGNA